MAVVYDDRVFDRGMSSLPTGRQGLPRAAGWCLLSAQSHGALPAGRADRDVFQETVAVVLADQVRGGWERSGVMLGAEQTLQELLGDIRACREAREWVGDKPLMEAWTFCERGDWMLWLAGKMVDKVGWWTRQQVVLAACECAELALMCVPDGEERPKQAIKIARRWARGENVSLVDVRKAAYAAAAAGDAAAFAAAGTAAFAAAAFAYAADAAGNADRATRSRQCADLVRQALPLSERKVA